MRFVLILTRWEVAVLVGGLFVRRRLPQMGRAGRAALPATQGLKPVKRRGPELDRLQCSIAGLRLFLLGGRTQFC